MKNLLNSPSTATLVVINHIACFHAQPPFLHGISLFTQFHVDDVIISSAWMPR